MFTSLRARLWLSYALVITVALGAVILVLLTFLVRNPVLYRETQQKLRAVQTQIVTGGRPTMESPEHLSVIAQSNDVRVLLFDKERALLFDSNPEQSPIRFPRRNIFGKFSQFVTDDAGTVWLHATTRVLNNNVLVVAVPRPTSRFFNLFTDELLVPILEGGVIAFLLALVLAFLLSRSVADPLQKMVSAARAYPAQPLTPLAPTGPGEVQDLTRAFNAMIERVEAAQKSQRDFVANVSHELKTPLTSIQGFAQAMLDGTADSADARKQSAQIIYDEAGRMHRMALDLLDLARFEGGTAELHMAPLDVPVLLRGVVEKFAWQAQKANIAMHVDLPAETLPRLLGDGDRLAQVFSNLLDNALKFTPAGGQVLLSAKKAEAWIEFEVADSGIGVEREAVPHLFERFYQVDPARKGGDGHGAGLGLAIAQEIVQAHGGKIGVRSSVGQGTVFTVRLPSAPM